MSKLKTKFVCESFVNHLNQTVNPGDDVAFIAKGYGSNFSVRKGVFKGVKHGEVHGYRKTETLDRWGGNLYEAFTENGVCSVVVDWNEFYWKDDGSYRLATSTLPGKLVYKLAKED